MNQEGEHPDGEALGEGHRPRVDEETGRAGPG